MTGIGRSSAGLDDRRKRLLFRCWHRGTREMDLIIGRFADQYLDTLTELEIDELERLIEHADVNLYASFTGSAPPPEGFAGGIFERIKAFQAGAPKLEQD
jgi:antitoxin CptB